MQQAGPSRESRDSGGSEGALPQAIFLMGPTASGKTDLAMRLAKRLPVDIISVDSALVYRGMNIGTAKPSKEELAEAPHRLVDILEPTESYSVARFYNDALSEMRSITSKGRIPLLVGGTMMYFRALRDGIASMPSADEHERAQINALADLKGWAHIHSLLSQVDPESAERIKPTDTQRLQRALEVYRVSGKTLTQFWLEQKRSGQGVVERSKHAATGKLVEQDYTVTEGALPPIPYDVLALAISPSDRKVLHARIEQRFRAMLDNDFEAEVRLLRSRGDLSLDMPSMRCVGYRQMWEYLDGNGSIDYGYMVERGIIATRQLAKRQLTWLRSWEGVKWLETNDKKNLDEVLKLFYSSASNP